MFNEIKVWDWKEKEKEGIEVQLGKKEEWEEHEPKSANTQRQSPHSASSSSDSIWTPRVRRNPPWTITVPSKFDDLLFTNDDDVDYNGELVHQILLADYDQLVFEEAMKEKN